MTDNANFRASLDLDAIKKRAEAATPGPWETGDGCNTAFGVHGRHPEIGHVWVADTFVDGDGHMADVEFIAHARSDVPTLVAEIERLEAENRMMRDEGCPQCREALIQAHEQAAGFRGEAEWLRAIVDGIENAIAEFGDRPDVCARTIGSVLSGHD